MDEVAISPSVTDRYASNRLLLTVASKTLIHLHCYCVSVYGGADLNTINVILIIKENQLTEKET